MSDELRDRIADVIDAGADAWQASTTDQRDELHAIAQTVIDDLDLRTYEFTPFNGPTRTYIHGEIKEEQ